MEANELRLGNLVHDKEGKVIKVQIIFEEWVNDLRYDCDFYVEELQPIPLTEELLIKCGFEVTWNGREMYFVAVKDRFHLCASMHGTHWAYSSGGYDAEFNDFEVESLSLHQLQNLFFILTGNELEIKQVI